MNGRAADIAEPRRQSRVGDQPGLVVEIAEHAVERNEMAAGGAGVEQHFGACIEQFSAFDRPAAAEVGLQVAVARAAETGGSDPWRGLDQIEATMHAEGAFDHQNEHDALRFHLARSLVAFDGDGRALHFFHCFRLGQHDGIEAGTHHRFKVAGEKFGRRRIHPHIDRRAAAAGRLVDGLGDQHPRRRLVGQRHGILQVQEYGVGAALHGLGHHALFQSWREQGHAYRLQGRPQ
jgi:hypothetical protein